MSPNTQAGIAEQASGISMYPNPAKDQFIIETPCTGAYRIFALNGQELQTGLLNSGKNVVYLQPNLVNTTLIIIEVMQDNGFFSREKLIVNP